MNPFLPLALIVVPLGFSIYLTFLPVKQEKFISWNVMGLNIFYGAGTLAFAVSFFLNGMTPIAMDLGEIYRAHDYSLHMQILADGYSVAFQGTIGFLSGLVFMFSRRYMHREPGYRRFFATLSLFLSGITLVALANTVDLLFAGWEIVGVSSFLLIGFYQNRRLPGKSALKTFAIYRFCDVGLFIGAWMFHELGSEFTFLDFSRNAANVEFLALHQVTFTIIGFLTLFAAMGKSAQYPFSFWVPRAMEGPTPSSAIFYGALSIHAGVYLAIRMYPVWTFIPAVRITAGLVGLVTTFVASISAKSQSNIKGQIGYASVAQTGVMFIELSLGFRELATLHLIGNAVLRCYQLLASPSVLVMYLKLQAEGGDLSGGVTSWITRYLNTKWRNRLFAFSFNEGYSETLISFFWNTLKKVASLVNRRMGIQVTILLSVAASVVATTGDNLLPLNLPLVISLLIGTGAIHLALTSLGENESPVRVLNNAAMSAAMTGVGAAFLNPGHIVHTLTFFLGLAGGYILARSALFLLKPNELHLNYAGNGDRYPGKTLLLLIGILWISGFTLSPTFIGEDLLLHFGAEQYAIETFLIAGTFILNGITLMRMYVRLTFAPY